MSLIEVAVLSSQHKIKLKATLDEFFQELQASPFVRILPITFEIASDVFALAVLRDPADRVIVATARVHHLRLLTSDQRIIESKLVHVVQ